MKTTTIGLDIAKSIFHLVMVNATGQFMKKKQLRRKHLLAYVTRLEPSLIVMEACGGAHHWARQFMDLGHQVKLIAPQYVKPFVKGNKNDYNDALAIAEAAQRPSMRFVPLKTVEQQDIQNFHNQRERFKKARTALVNQTRGLLAEYGIVINKGINALRSNLPSILEDADNGLTTLSRELLAEQLDELRELDQRLKSCERRIQRLNKDNEVCVRLETVLGIGPLIASATYAAVGQGKAFINGRHYAAWMGVVPRQHSSGGKATLLGISKRGNAYLRTLYIHGARSVLKAAHGKSDRFSQWALAVQARRGHNKACVAVANKLARMAWVIMAKDQWYHPAV